MLTQIAVTVGFTRETYTVDENERSVTITIELNSGIPFRSFLIHFETFEQQAKEGNILRFALS